MGQPPCKYALIGLGSLERDLATPYSDLESAILIEENKEEYKCYFRLLSYFLHIKVIDLGETIVPALAINSLNDFIGKNDWFFDSETPRGFSFDGAMPWASKIPHGREATPSKREPMELIKIPAQMADLLTEEIAAQEGYHLADIMVDATLISGNKKLVEQYKHCCDHILSKSSIKVSRNTSTAMEYNEIKSVKQARGYSNLLDGISEFNISSTVLDSEGKSYNVKREIYRFPTITINSLAWVFNITSSNLWNAVKELQKRQVINSDAKHNLHVIISLAAELRLASYIKHGRQREELVVRESGGSDGGMLLSPNQQKIVRYYFTALPFKDTIESILNKNTSNSSLSVGLQNNHLYKSTDYYRGQIYERLMMYSEAEVSYKSAMDERGEETPKLYLNLARLEIQLGKFDEAKKCVHEHSEKYPGKQPARVSNCLGNIYQGLGDYNKAVAYFQESLAMKKQIYGEHAAHPHIASSLNNLCVAWGNKGDYDKALAYHQESLAMWKQIHGDDAAHPHIARSLGNLGSAWYYKGDYDKAVAYHQESLAMKKQIYGEHAAHPDIASSLNNLGNTWKGKGDDDKAVAYHQESLTMKKQIYGEHAPHPHIASSLGNLGSAWNHKGDYDKALAYHQESLAMRKQIYGEDAAHPDIAKSLNNLGNAWDNKGDYDKALAYHQESLAMQKQIYGEDAPHPYIASSLNNLGNTWKGKGDYDKALAYHQESLTMRKQIYGEDATHPDITQSLNSLGVAFRNKLAHPGGYRCTSGTP